MIADDEQRAHRLAFAAFAADVDGQIDHRLERVERDARLELAQIADRQLAQVLAQANDAQRVDHRRLEAAVHGDDRSPRPATAPRPPLPSSACVSRSYTGASGGMLSRIVSKSSSATPSSVSSVSPANSTGVLAGRLPQPRPIGRPLHQKQHRVGFVHRGQSIGQLAKRLQLIGEFARERPW